MSRMAFVVLVLVGALSACSGDPVRGMAMPGSNIPTAAPTTTTTPASRSSAAPTTTTIPPTTSAAPAPVLPFNPTTLWSGAQLSSHVAVMLAPQPRVTVLEMPFRGLMLRYDGIGEAAVDVTLVAEQPGNPAYQAWYARATKDGTHDSVTCPVYGFCSGGSPARRGRPDGPTAATFLVANVKGVGALTVRIELVGDAKPINSINALRGLSGVVNDNLPK